MSKKSVASYCSDLQEHFSPNFNRTVEELVVVEQALVKCAEIHDELKEQKDELWNAAFTELRYAGIYEAHLRGVLPEEIAHYGDYRVEFVEEVIKHKDLEAYSRRTGNAIISKWPGRD